MILAGTLPQCYVYSFSQTRMRQSRVHEYTMCHFSNGSIKSLCNSILLGQIRHCNVMFNALLFHKPMELMAGILTSTPSGALPN